jgi:hypothetical protein
LKNEKPTYNNAYSLWRVNGYQQGFPSVASFGFGGQESASKPPQAICKLCSTLERQTMSVIFNGFIQKSCEANKGPSWVI